LIRRRADLRLGRAVRIEGFAVILDSSAEPVGVDAERDGLNARF
jgi:hypothetical protein